MKISNHLLLLEDGKPVTYKASPNKGGVLNPQYLIMHYTAATRGAGSVSWFLNNAASASAHLLIDRDGSIIQFAPFNVVTWHAGNSRWNGLVGMNNYSIGIELVNGGRLTKIGDKWVCPVDKQPVSDTEVLVARHKNDQAESGWHEYTEAQLRVASEVAALLAQTYQLKDVLGHDDISPLRKSDPGPAFPMDIFRSKAMGRKEDSDTYKTTAELNVRSGPGTQHPLITDPLPPGTNVHILKREGNWSYVEVLDVVHGLNDLEGWVFSKYLVK